MKPKRLGRELKSTSNLFSRNLENCEAFRYALELTSANAFILGFLARNSDIDIYQKTIEEKFSITKSTASKVLKLMEQNGLIERLIVPNDARLKKIVITEKGLNVSKSVRNGIDSVQEKAFKGFSQEEQDNLFSYLERIKENLKN